MLKRLITYAVLAVTVFQTSAVHATDLDKAFSSFIGDANVTSTGPGRYNSASRTTFVAGGIEARFPQGTSQVSLLSISPPSMPTAGCGGISAHFGGFSFVSGDQIEKLIKNIGQNAVGMVVSVVIKTLCPICDAVIQAMTKLAQDASKLAVDSCAVAQNLVGMAEASFKEQSGPNESFQSNVCGQAVTVSGKESDWLGAVQGIDGACSSLSKAMTNVGNVLRKAEGKGGSSGGGATEDEKALAAKIVYFNEMGNTTWNILNEVYGTGYDKNGNQIPEFAELQRNKMLLMNVLGTSIITDPEKPGVPYLPGREGRNSMLSPKQLFELFMCGAPAGYTDTGDANSGWVKTPSTIKYCKYFYGSIGDKSLAGQGQSGGYDWQVYECAAAEGDPTGYKECVNLVAKPLRESNVLKGAGFLPQTERVLYDAVETVATNGTNGKDLKKLISLANGVNFPIYQAVNAAAVYPASAGDLMSTMSVLVAESLVYAKMEEVLRPQGRNPNAMKIKRDLALRIYDVLEGMNKMHLSQRESYGRMMAVQEGAVHSIRQINLAIQKQVMTPELLGNSKYSSAVVNSMQEPASSSN